MKFFKFALKLSLTLAVPALVGLFILHLDDIAAFVKAVTGEEAGTVMAVSAFFGGGGLILTIFVWGALSGKFQSTSNGSPRASKDLDDDEPITQA